MADPRLVRVSAGCDPSSLFVRLCAGAALASVATHAWMAWEHRGVPWESGLMLLMAAICLPCAVSVWHGARASAVSALLVMALVMVTVHAAILLSPGTMTIHQHGSRGEMAISATPQSHAGAMLSVIALELAVAPLAAWAMRQERCRAAHAAAGDSPALPVWVSADGPRSGERCAAASGGLGSWT